jgi:hypothetical protein
MDCEFGIGEDEVLHLGGVNPTEDALDPVGLVVTTLIEADATQGVALPVEVAGEIAVFAITDCGVVALRITETFVTICDIGRHHEVRVTVFRTAVHIVSQLIEVVNSGYSVGISLRAATARELCSRRGGREQSDEQRQCRSY